MILPVVKYVTHLCFNDSTDVSIPPAVEIKRMIYKNDFVIN